MMVLITYDVSTVTVSGKKRLRDVAKRCRNYGQRVQNSVFECIVEPQQLVSLKEQLLSLMDSESDSLRIYYLGSNWKRRIEHFGAKKSFDLEGPLIV
ncbi:MAG: CRISPR-associated endonuclease Cas2 [bacterium]|jgi:CRISPR-associated protein Cas2